MQTSPRADITYIGVNVITVKCAGGNIIRQGRLMDDVTKDCRNHYSTSRAVRQSGYFFDYQRSTTEYIEFHRCKRTVAGGVRGRATAHNYAAPGGWQMVGGGTGEYASSLVLEEHETQPCVENGNLNEVIGMSMGLPLDGRLPVW